MTTMTPYRRQQSLGALINVIAYRLRNEFDVLLRAHGLDVSVWPVLVCLWEQDGVPQARIGELLGVPGYAMSRGVDRLEAAGMVIRQSDPDNRRIRRVFLTEAGRSLQARLAPLAVAANVRALEVLSAQEQETLLALLQKLHGAA